MVWRFTLVLSAILVPVSLLYAHYRYKYNYFERHGIPFPISDKREFQNNFKQLLRRVYNKFRTIAPIAGIYLNKRPAIVILDLELIKRVLIEDFTNFHDRFNDQSSKKDLLHTFQNTEWQATRRKLTPCFWSAKMDFIFPNVIKAAEESLSRVPIELETSTQALDLNNFCTNYATNALLSCVFGAELNQNKADESTKALRMLIKARLMNEYETRFSKDSVMTNLRCGPCTTHAQATKPELSAHLESAVRELLEERRVHKVKGNDIIQIFVDMLTNESGVDDTEQVFKEHELQLITQTLAMLLTGFANSAKMLTHCLHELARNKEIQQKLRYEIERVIQKYDNAFCYEAMGHMHYLDQVVAETLRKYPISAVLIRRTLNDYQVPGTGYKIEHNICVLVPVHAIHHDPEIYPAPEQFDPSRFDAAAVMARHACAYLSFDDGPRNCMGKRLSKMLIKVAVVTLLRSYVMECENRNSENSATVYEEDEDAQSEIRVKIRKVV